MTKRMKITGIILLVFVLALTAVFVGGCGTDSNKLQDGYYTAEDKNGSHGWYEYITIYVNDGTIVSCEYNAKNSSGFIKAWDMNYMKTMNATDGTYPNEYTRTYASQFLEAQSADGVDCLTGATHSYDTFIPLAKAVIEKAKAGDHTVALVDVKHEQ